MKSVRIATIGSPGDYQQSLFPIIAQSLGYAVEWTTPQAMRFIGVRPLFKSKPQKDGVVP